MSLFLCTICIYNTNRGSRECTGQLDISNSMCTRRAYLYMYLHIITHWKMQLGSGGGRISLL